MLENKDICEIPLENYLNEDGLVVIWCTNAGSHIEAIKNQFLKKWNLQLIANWYWVKITKSGQPVCKFNELNKKQPYEQIFVAANSASKKDFSTLIEKEKIIYSIPSAFHSHKPPLIGKKKLFYLKLNNLFHLLYSIIYILELFSNLVPENPKCLEIFARNLYPNFTSIGLEVLKLQNVKLFDSNVNNK